MTPPIRSLKDLQAALSSGQSFEYLFFWGHRARVPGVPDKACFSQWWEAPFSLAGHTYPTAEHWMMAGKARLFGDEAALERILASRTPAEVKKLGRGVRGFNEATWAAHRFALVVEGNLAKFGQHLTLERVLRATGERVLVEASPVDFIWGIGLPGDDGRAQDPTQWQGLNLLGFALMDVRSRLGG